MAVEFLFDGSIEAPATVLLAHGAGAAMDNPVMNMLAERLAASGLRVARFEFAYMAARRSGGPKRPPPKVELLCEEYRQAVTDLRGQIGGGPLIIGGKSMGGRVASLIADDLGDGGQVQGLLCFGYPFHPQGKPENLRTTHLANLRLPTLICHGTRDPFGTREEVAHYALSPMISICWAEDGDHDLKPRKRVTGRDHASQLDQICQSAAAWIPTL
ncbi:Alpha/beta hydrolase family protein [Thalassovita autumnalis]|uniref:Alpha/beta hydrolase family protein n=1 Tax=Thalassovita autumnalis TaxID=2072972 RepID=A0A0P1F630_9RHOB|nr:alpha/beta family hydrolase [Thalassovita autumnalis]CUH63251.1 Alpha/beta hydrolase family protein [Thalassovita autumnalis]CUH72004.1 Alpha/beta hydrolase family protein [Thalassovita autumnalis]